VTCGRRSAVQGRRIVRDGFVGDYHYGSSVIDGQRYAIIENRGVIERIRIIQSIGNPVIWAEGDPLTVEIMAIIAQAKFTI
jgi:hypothetical protein